MMGFADSNIMGAVIGEAGSAAGVAVDISIPDGAAGGTRFGGATGLVDFSPGKPLPPREATKTVEPKLVHIGGPDYQPRATVDKRMDMRESLIQAKMQEVMHQWKDKNERYIKAQRYIAKYRASESLTPEIETKLEKCEKIVGKGVPMTEGKAREEALKILGFAK